MRQKRLRVAACALALAAVATACGEHGEPVASLRPGGASGAAVGTPNAAAIVARYVGQMKKYVVCLRKHGLPEVADPDAFGGVLIDTSKATADGLSHSRLACQHLQVPMPPEVRELAKKAQPPADLTPAQREANRRYATCMQSHGAPDFPDPQPDGAFPLPDFPGDVGDWDEGSPSALRASSTCGPIIGAPATMGPGVG